jgi:cytochrome c biogenesis protein CcmG/thiol:disulfide interchange protein DsbE
MRLGPFMTLSVFSLAAIVSCSSDQRSGASKNETATRSSVETPSSPQPGVGTVAQRQPQSQSATKTAARRAPGFRLEDITGKVVDYSQFDGNVVLVDFWATWCPPCRRGIPELAELHQKYASKGFQVIGISLDASGSEVVRKFSKDYKIPYTVLMGNRQVVTEWQVGSSIPTAFLVNRQGEIVKPFVGYQQKEVLEQEILRYL